MRKRLLSTVTFLLLVSVGLTGPASAELVGWWPLDEGSGTVTRDATGNGNDATFNGDPQWVVGQLGGALEFDGSGDWLDCANSGSLAFGDAVSMAAWIKVGALGLDHKVGGNQDNADGGYKMSIFSNNKVEFEVRTSSNNGILNRNAPGGTLLEVDTWYHVIGVYSRSEGYIRTYVNGALDRDMATAEVLGVSSGPMRLGCEPFNTGGNNFNGVMDDVRVYSHALTEEEMPLIMLGGRTEELSSAPQPTDEAVDVPRDVVLGWKPGSAAVTHDVYFGTAFEDVNDADRTDPRGVLVSRNQDQTSYDPDGLLEFGQTYYWRVDEVNGAPDYTIFEGTVWSFTVEPFAYAIQDVVATSNAVSESGRGPERAVDGSGLNENDEHSTDVFEMWSATPNSDGVSYIQFDFNRVYTLHEMLIWNYNMEFESMLGMGLKDVTVEYSLDGTTWAVLGDWQLAQGPGSDAYTHNTVIAFESLSVKAVRLLINSRWGFLGNLVGLSEVRFLYIPTHAREPQPANGAAGVAPSTTLSWRAGRDSVSHEVYLGTDQDAVADGSALTATTTEASYASGNIQFGHTYYWKVNELSASASEGDLWSFTTQELGVIDGFEAYTDNWEAGEAIWQTWIDGWEDNTNGSQVGYATSPFAEGKIVYRGEQSMPLTYNNGSASRSEAYMDLAGRDLSANGAQYLSLYVYGDPNNQADALYVGLEDSAGHTERVMNTDPNILLLDTWRLWIVPLDGFSSAGVNLTSVDKVYIGVGRPNGPASNSSGQIFIDNLGVGTPLACNELADVTLPGDLVIGLPNDANWPAVEAPNLVIDNSTGTKFLHFEGTQRATGIETTPGVGATVVTALTFTTANDAPERDPVAFEFYGSNAGIDGPYTLIASGDIVDFAQTDAWPRLTPNATPISFDNDVAYSHYRLLFPTVRDPGSANSMQIAEVELIGRLAQ